MNVLVTYASKHGSTKEVAESVAATLREHENIVAIKAAGSVDDLDGYDSVVLGAALYIGRLHRDGVRFLERHRRELASRRLFIFAMGPESLAEEKVASSRAQLDRALAHTAELEPESLAIFGGVVTPDKLRFPFNRMTAVDARDWLAVHAWADGVAEALTDGHRGCHSACTPCASPMSDGET